MITRENLLSHFENIVQFEEDSKNLYEEYIDKLGAPMVIETLKSIRDDEITHIKAAKRLIEIVKEK